MRTLLRIIMIMFLCVSIGLSNLPIASLAEYVNYGDEKELSGTLDGVVRDDHAPSYENESALDQTSDEVSAAGIQATVVLADNLLLEYVSYQYTAGSDQNNPGAIGELLISATVTGPSSVANVRISSWMDTQPDAATARQRVEASVASWKQSQSSFNAKTLPYEFMLGRPVFETDSGKTQYVILAAMDTGVNLVGYAVISVEMSTTEINTLASGTWGNLSWILDENGQLTVSGSGEMQNFTDNSTEAWNAYRDQITSVMIEPGVTRIGSYALKNCNNLNSITIPEGVTRIGYSAFYGCKNLSRLTIPSSVTYFDNSIFIGCDGLKTAGPIGSGYNYEFGWTDTIPTDAFRFCYKLTSIVIPSGITSIGRSAFLDCRELTNMLIPSSVTSIGDSAFYGCSKLTGIDVEDGNPSYCDLDGVVFSKDQTELCFFPCAHSETYIIPSSVTSIKHGAFGGNSLLQSVTIPQSVTNIGGAVFEYCISLTSIAIPNNVTTIQSGTFYGCSSLSSISIPSGVTDIQTSAFYGCRNVTSIMLPASISSIGDSAFKNCNNLAEVYYEGTQSLWNQISKGTDNDPLSNAAIHFGDEDYFSGTWGNLSWTLDNNGQMTISGSGEMQDFTDNSTEAWNAYRNQITSVMIEPGVTCIGSYALKNCNNLNSITIPEGVTSIGYSAFYGCKNLSSLTIPSSVTYFGNSIFIGCDGLKTAGPIGGGYDYEFGWTDAIPTDAFRFCFSLTSIVIPSGITSIGKCAFLDCRELTNMLIPSSVTSFGDSAFYGCSKLTGIDVDDGNPSYCDLDGVVFSKDQTELCFFPCAHSETYIIPSSVTSIKHGAFGGNSLLKSVTIPQSVTNIGSAVFENCISLVSVAVPNNVTVIQNSTFYGCSSLSSISIPSGVTDIKQFAFYGCSNLSDVFYGGIQDQWNAIDLGTYNDPLINAIVHYEPTGATAYNISYDANGGTGAPAGQTKTHDIILTLSNVMPSHPDTNEESYTVALNANGGNLSQSTLSAERKTVYSFINWNTIVNGSGVSYTPGASYTDNSSVTLYAQWDSNTITEAINLPNPIRNGYSFKGWSTTSTDETSVIIGSYTPLENITLYAIWEPETYTVTYNANGGTSAPDDQTKTYNVALTLSTDTPSREDASAGSYTVTLYANGGSVSQSTLTAERTMRYSFNSWNTAENGSGTSFAPGASYSANTSLTLYAQWSSSIVTGTVELPTPTRNGYGFKGWSTGTSAVNGITGSYTPSGNVALYAIWEAGTYTVAYDANGGTDAPAGQTKTHDIALTLSSTVPLRAENNSESYIVTLNANGSDISPALLEASRTTSYSFNKWNTMANGSGTDYAPGAQYTANVAVTLYAQWNSITVTETVDLPTPTRTGYSFKGWSTSSNSTSGIIGSYTPSGNITLYAIWEAKNTYTVSYSANGGTGTPSSQIKEEDVPLTLSSIVPSRKYIIQYNAAGGSVSPASKNVYCTFTGWNTLLNGNGTSYLPGDTYMDNTSITLYAQWANPSAGTFPVPTRNGYEFAGWFTSANGGEQIYDTSTVVANMTVYAHWSDIYNMGDETYSFPNFGDSDSPYGHCFGMSITSAGYHNGLLNIGIIGGNANTPLYSFGQTQTVKAPICRYQGKQGSLASLATVAGGSMYLYGYNNIASDWRAVVDYVRNHDYDNTGLLQIGFRKNNEGGHAINFLRYENINGQDRIYAYDNNFPQRETYFYQDAYGNVWQAPVQTFSGSIDCIALRDCRIYFNYVGDFDITHVLYMGKDSVTVQGYSYSYMDSTFSDEEYVMYEIPSDQDRVVIIPNRDNADFIYLDTEYSFGEITENTRGELRFASLNEGSGSTFVGFRIYEVDSVFAEPDFVLPSALNEIGDSAFEGITATTIYVPDNCVSIGSYAFRNASIRQIRIPENCSIADTAFDGCTKVEIFGTPGSPAETYCSSHDNCRFLADNE